MSLNPTRTLLLAMALILSQWLMLGHASEHVVPAEDLSCQICLHAERSGSGPVMQPAQLALAPRSCEAPELEPAPVTPRRDEAICSIRGPPGPSFPHKE
ncbi:hypothetical protein [Algiphilus aromaticivorans]|jgi:hypothetical protein|uniref:hypothetical protein n=1 Tax=Algiphilus aromaticivorans TaxID=382454 RepID=UPI0005C1C3C5|nr:hypothetical protein [Algiphilus aromaticivorans]